MLQIEKDLISFKTHKGVNRLLWKVLKVIEELYDDGSNFSEDELRRIKELILEEGDSVKDELELFLRDLEKTEIKLKSRL